MPFIPPGFTKRTKMTYGGYEFIPAPLFGWTTNFIKSGDGSTLSEVNTLDFQGDLLFGPAASGSLDGVIGLQDELRAALKLDNQEFVISYDGISIVSGIYPRIENVSIDQGVWTDRAVYNFSATYEVEVSTDKIESFSETWQFDERDDRRSVNVQHTINSIGLNTNPSGVNNAFSNAKDYVLTKTGYSNAQANAPFFVQVSGLVFNSYEELRTENHDVQNSSFGVTENFILSSGTNIHTQTSQYGQDTDGVVTVSVNGQVKGLGRGDTAYNRALSVFNTTIEPNLANIASGTYTDFNGPANLFTNNKEGFSVTKSEFAGTIDYSVSYNDSPGENLPDDIQEFNMTVSVNEPTELVAIFLIPERTQGPIQQKLNTTKPGTYTLAGNCVGKPSSDFAAVTNFVKNQLIANKGPGIITQNNIVKDSRKKTISFNVTWEFTATLNEAVTSIPKL